jgi:hypothetical protein
MRNIIFAVMITVGTSVFLFLLSWAVGLPAEASKGVAGLPALAIKNIYDLLETQSAKRMLAHAESLVTAFILAVIMFVGMVNFTSAVTGFLVGMVMSQHEDVAQSQSLLILTLIVITSIPLNLIGISYIGRWIGYRSLPIPGLAVAIAATVIGVLASLLFSVVILPLIQRMDPTHELLTGEVLQKIIGTGTLFGLFHEIISNKWFLTMQVLIYIIAISFGAWQGQRARFARYLAFILRVLLPETRQAIVEIARDEALRASSARGRRAPKAVRV